MIFLHIIVEGFSEEIFINETLKPHLLQFDIYTFCRKLRTGWDGNKPAKGGLLKYIKFKNDVLKWIEADRGRGDVWYTSMLDLYAFPQDDLSPYQKEISDIEDRYRRIEKLENAIGQSIGHARFIPYVQLHEFEAFLLVEPDRLLEIFIDKTTAVRRLKSEIAGMQPELINDKAQTAPSKRIIKFIPEYEGLKSTAGPLIAGDIGLTRLREGCPHFNRWVTYLENLNTI